MISDDMFVLKIHSKITRDYHSSCQLAVCFGASTLKAAKPVRRQHFTLEVWFPQGNNLIELQWTSNIKSNSYSDSDLIIEALHRNCHTLIIDGTLHKSVELSKTGCCNKAHDCFEWSPRKEIFQATDMQTKAAFVDTFALCLQSD